MNPEEGRRQAGWGAPVLLLAATLLLWVLEPLPLVAAALAALCLLLPPRRLFVATGALLLGVALARLPAIAGAGTVSLLWGAAAGVGFAEASRRFPGAAVLSRALAGVTAAVALASIVFAASGEWNAFDAAVRARFADAASLWVQEGGTEWPAEVRAALERAAALQGQLYPALAGLQTLAGLALAWAIRLRLRDREGARRGRFRDLRFGDHWVWALIAGLVLMLVPGVAALSRVGANLLVFMGAVYALRGLAVISSLASGAPTLLKVVFGGLAALLFPPAAVLAAALVGLGDTWLDVRRRLDEAAPPA